MYTVQICVPIAICCFYRSGVTCGSLEKAFGCSCAGCACKDPPVCDAKAIKSCADAYKKPCEANKKGLKNVKCGGCIAGYAPNGKGDCDQIITTPKPTQPKPTQPKPKPTTKKPDTPKDACGNAITKTCGNENLKGDGYCDDPNNNPGCDWDGGDCCGKSGKAKQLSYCLACKCLDCNGESGDDCVKKFADKVNCGDAAYKGDGNCDDSHNNAFCGWDGGDCCGPKVVKTYCKEVSEHNTCVGKEFHDSVSHRFLMPFACFHSASARIAPTNQRQATHAPKRFWEHAAPNHTKVTVTATTAITTPAVTGTVATAVVPTFQQNTVKKYVHNT